MKPSYIARVLFGCMLCSGLLLAPAARAQATLTLFSVDRDFPILRTINPATGATTASVTMTLAGQTIQGATGLATHPQTGQIFVILKLQGQANRFLATVNPTTGVVTSIGDTGDLFAGLAFDCAGTLYGVTGDGANNISEAVFTLNQTTGAATLLTRLGRGDDGEAIAFNPLDNLIYHGSGISGNFNPVNNGGVIFESFNPATPPFTAITVPANLSAAGEVQAITFQAGTGNFLWKGGTGATGPLFSVTPAGVATMLGTMDHQVKGLAFSGATLFSVSPVDNNLRTINPATGATTGSVLINLVGVAVSGLTGLAVHPTNGTVFGLMLTGGVGQQLVTINTGTGAATSIGNTGHDFVGIAFDAAGTLWGVTGSGASIPNALFTINTTSAVATYRYPVDRNNSGKALAFNSANGNLYFASGSTASDMTFERVNQNALPVDIPISGSALTNNEIMALTFRAATGNFLWKQRQIVNPLFEVTPAGAPTVIGPMDHQSKGLTYAGPGAIACSANIGVTKTDSPDPVTLGSNITYTITISNAGPNPAVGVMATDVVPANVTFVSGTGSQGTCAFAAGTVTCNVGTINSGAAATATVVVTANAIGTVTNTVNVTATTSDPAAANDAATATTTVGAAAATDFTISASPAVANASPGGSATFTVSVAPTPVGSTFAGMVTYSCFVQPPLSSCSVSPVTVAVPSSSTLTVNVPSFAAAPRPFNLPPMLMWMLAFGLALTGVGVASRRLGHRRLAHCTALGMILLALSLVMFQSGCTSQNDTLAGPYVVTVTGSAPGGLSHSTNVTVNVQ